MVLLALETFGAFGVVTRRLWDDSDVSKPFLSSNPSLVTQIINPPPVIPIRVFQLRRLFEMAGIYRPILSFSSPNSQVHTQEQQR